MLCVTFMPQGVSVEVEPGTSLLSAQIQAGLHPDAPCGGKGTCGKCRVRLGQQEVLACQTPVTQPMTVWLPEKEPTVILTQGLEISARPDGQAPYTAAFDIGTTTLVGFLLACGVLVVQFLMDDQIRDSDYLIQTYDIPVLAVIPDLLSTKSTNDYYKSAEQQTKKVR